MQRLKLLPKLSDNSVKELKEGKNLLAFSAGVDSTALFFILKEYGVEFDMATVDYGLREQSAKECEYALFLAKRYDKKLYFKKADLKLSNFEHSARVFRYDFFKEIIKEHNYTHLITAHQLNDKLEWFLMQFTKGAGLIELLGFDEIRKRDNYTLVRPLIEISKDELLKFLQANNIKYFIDESNFDIKYKRNYFRKNFTNTLLKEYKKGIISSFKYLENDKNLLDTSKIYKKIKKLYILKDSLNDITNQRAIDKTFKELGYLLSKKQKDEIIQKRDVVISGRFAVAFSNGLIYISPFLKTKMDKKFKEKCRIQKIPPKIRGYIYKELSAKCEVLRVFM